MREIDPDRQYGKVVAHLAGAFVATVALAAVTWVDPEALRWVLALLAAGNGMAAMAAYIGWI
jgi:hypothetical protein